MLDNHLSVHIRREISHSHMTYAETIPSWFLLNLNVVQVTLTLFDMGGGGMMAPKMFLTTVPKRLGGGSCNFGDF